MEGFLLGLAGGATCLAYCAPVLLPLLLGEGRPVRANAAILAEFLIGRLGGYLLFGLLAWGTGSLILDDPLWRGVLFGAAYAVLAILLLAFGLARRNADCLLKPAGLRAWLSRRPLLLPVGMGFLTGLNLCPPFLLAFAGAAYSGSLIAGLLFFAAFFAGTSVYLLPLPFLGVLRRHAVFAAIGRMAAVLMAAYYLYAGIFAFVGGLS